MNKAGNSMLLIMFIGIFISVFLMKIWNQVNLDYELLNRREIRFKNEKLLEFIVNYYVNIIESDFDSINEKLMQSGKPLQINFDFSNILKVVGKKPNLTAKKDIKIYFEKLKNELCIDKFIMNIHLLKNNKILAQTKYCVSKSVENNIELAKLLTN